MVFSVFRIDCSKHAPQRYYMEASRNVVYALAEVTFSRALLAAFFFFSFSSFSRLFICLYALLCTLRFAVLIRRLSRPSGDVLEARGF